MVRNLRGWAMSPRGRRWAAAVAQLTGAGILVAVLWVAVDAVAGWAAIGSVVVGWGLLVSWADS